MVEPRELVTYLNGEILPHSEAVTALQGKNLESSGGFYDVERTFNGRLFKLGHHLERLYRGLKSAGVEPGMTPEEMEAVTREVLEANLHLLRPGHEFTVTQVVSTSPTASPKDEAEVNVAIYCQPLQFSAFARSYVRGVRVVTPATYSVPQDRQGPDSQQVFQLMTSREGSITECTGANFMFARDGRIKLPDRQNVLPGVSMQTVLELVETHGVPIDEDEFSTYDVYIADEAFVCSTRFCLLPVATLNGVSLGAELPGPLTRMLLDAWGEMVGVDFVRQALDHLPPETGDPQPDGA